jgi:hypothetical protein
MVKLVHGVGVSLGSKYPKVVGGVQTVEYQLWKNMIARCYSESWGERNPTYVGCTVSENFKNFQYFAEWCQSQIGFGNKGWQLDKDILIKGNKVYSEDTCVFVPKEINMWIQNKRSNRGGLPIGVSYHTDSGKYVAQCGINGTRVHLGLYANPEGAFEAYAARKSEHLKERAEYWKLQIDVRLYDALRSAVIEPFP